MNANRLLSIIKSNQGKLGLLLICATTLGVISAVAARGYLKEQLAQEKARLQPNVPTIHVVVAKEDLPKGSLISNENMAVRQIPREFVNASAVTPDRFESFAGMKLNSTLRSGEPLLSSLMQGVEQVSFSQQLKPGVRAITVGVDEITSVSGMLQPGDRIDLLWSVKPQILRPQDQRTHEDALEQTIVFMQDVRVLATGKQVRPGVDDSRPRGYTTVTLEATAAQAQQLVIAQRSGKLTALLRNPDDNTPLNLRDSDLSRLLRLGQVPLTQKTPEPKREVLTTEIIVGGKGDLAKQIHAQSGVTP